MGFPPPNFPTFLTDLKNILHHPQKNFYKDFPSKFNLKSAYTKRIGHI